MSVIQRPSDAPTTELVVAVAVHAESGDGLAQALEAVRGQAYDVGDVFVIGGAESGQATAEEGEVRWVGDLRQLLDDLTTTATHVWLLHGDARPRPDALQALATEAARVDAAIAGSKVLRTGSERRLESVGAATDVFGHPYTGLEPSEVDQEQHDAVRDVSYVLGVSMLVRRDLLKGLGGLDPLMAPEAAAIDLCSRARLAGGRVVVVPSSEVVHAGACVEATPEWREQAGSIRAMAKNYSWLTLPWALPSAFVVGLVTAFMRTFLDRRLALWDFTRAWLWNLLHLPSVLSARSSIRRARVYPDDELFRYQVRGSVAFQKSAREFADRVRSRAEDQAPEVSAEDDDARLRPQPAFFAVVFGLVFVLAATWSLWLTGVPVTGFTLPLGDSAWTTLGSYAGGWNPGGFGSPHPLHPSVGAMALVHAAFLSNGDLAALALTVGAVALGLVGATRLLRRLGVRPFARYVSGLALVAGPASLGLTGAGYWPGAMAVAAVPWAVAAVLGPWPAGWRPRLGRGASATLAFGVLAVFAPAALAVPIVALVTWALFSGGSWWVPLRAIASATLALVFLFPWLAAVSVSDVLLGGVAAFWEPAVLSIGALTVAVLLGLLVGDSRTVALSATGGLLIALGGLISRSTEVGDGVGRELAVAGLVAAALGSLLAVGAAVDLPGRLHLARLPRRLVGVGAAAAGLLVAVSAVVVIPEGRAGLPTDRFGTQLSFTVNRAEEHGPDRVLLVGPDGTLPGEYRTLEDFTYRVVSAPAPPLAEAWLDDPRLGDFALEAEMTRLMAEPEVRPGASLAPFGIRWIVLTGPTRFEAALGSQLDMRPLFLLDYQVFENEQPSPRAVRDDGTPWSRVGVGYEGTPRSAGRVHLAENIDARWGPEWQAFDWANDVSARAGQADFAGVSLYRRLTWLVGGILVVLLGIAIWGRERWGGS